MQRKKTSIVFEQKLWKEAKRHCLDNDIELSTYLEHLVRKDLAAGEPTKETTRHPAKRSPR